MEKATAQNLPSRVAPLRRANGTHLVSGATQDSFALERMLGNQGMLQLLESGGLQAKLRVSQSSDADEREADRAAEHVVSSQAAPRLQRKCACGGSCSQCQEEEIIHRSARTTPLLGSFPFSIQRQTAATTTTSEDTSRRASAAEAGTREDQAKHPGERPRMLIVEDDAPTLGPGQMRKREFVTLLQTTTCATADAVLESVGHTTKGCPYIKKWLEHYKRQDAAHLMRAMRKYAPETVRARSAHEAIALVNQRVERAALSWAKTGKVTDLPEGIQEEMTGEKAGGGFLGAVTGFAHSGFGRALLGFIGGGKREEKEGKPSGASIQRKSREGAAAGEHDAAAVKEQLGSGQALDGGVASRMGAAFGYDFSRVRVHTDTEAGELSGRLNARAFTIGSDVAFAGGEYKPGTLVGDALIAHELAHVVQQGGGNQAGPQSKDASLGDESSLEQDADRSAVGAVVSMWTGAKTGLAQVGTNALPRLKSGLKLQRCASCTQQTVKPASPQPTPARPTPPAPTPSTDEPKGLGEIIEDIAVTTCDPDLGKMTWRPRHYEHIPICAADCVKAHEEEHVRFGQKQCAKVSALYQAAEKAIKDYDSSKSQATLEALQKAAQAFKKGVDDYKKWHTDSCKENEGRAYQAGIDKCLTTEVQKQCADLGETDKLKKFIKGQKEFQKKPPDCDEATK